MDEPWLCTGGRHVAPASGGSCPCGMVTRIPAPQQPAAGPPPEVLVMLARVLDEWTESLEAAASRLLRELEGSASRLHGELEAAAARLLREQGEQLRVALSTTGLTQGAGNPEQPVVRHMEPAQVAALAHTAPRAAGAGVVPTPTSDSAWATVSARIDRAPSEFDTRRAEVAVSVAADGSDAGETETLRPPASGEAAAPRPLRDGVGRDRADGRAGRRARKKAGQNHRRQPGRVKRPDSADAVIHPPATRPGDRPMGSIGILGQQGPPALRQAV